MQLEAALDQLQFRYMGRVKIHPGNGLSRAMNSSLKSYIEIPRIIRRSADCLASLEYLFGLKGNVSVNCADLYQILINAHDDWHLEFPQVIDGTVTFRRTPRLPRHQFTAAWAIARRIHLLTGHGSLRLHSDALDEFRRLIRTQSEGWHDKV